PPQDHTIDRANQIHDPRTRSGAGTVVTIDEVNRTIDLKRGAWSSVPHPTALIPCDVVGTQDLRASLLRIARWVVEHGIGEAGPFRAARDLLMRKPPRLREGLLEQVVARAGEPIHGARRAALQLEDSVLAIQGPPGSGKTYVGAHMVLELVKNQKRVGITGPSHKVITNILDAVCRAADAAAMPLRAVQKVGNDGEASKPGPDQSDDATPAAPELGTDSCERDRTNSRVTRVTRNEEVVDAIKDGVDVIAGTAWLWAREDMASAVDVLVVDEAGQMTLANALAASQAASSLVLLGDPQQLDQPQKG